MSGAFSKDELTRLVSLEKRRVRPAAKVAPDAPFPVLQADEKAASEAIAVIETRLSMLKKQLIAAEENMARAQNAASISAQGRSSGAKGRRPSASGPGGAVAQL